MKSLLGNVVDGGLAGELGGWKSSAFLVVDGGDEGKPCGVGKKIYWIEEWINGGDDDN